MKLGKVHKDTTDVSRVVVDCSRWLDKAEMVIAVSLPTVVTDYAPGAVPQGNGEVLYPPDSTPLTIAAPSISGPNITLMMMSGTPTLAYWVEFLVTGSSGRIKTLEIYTHCNPLIPTESLVNGIYPPVSVSVLPTSPPIDPNRLWSNGNMVAVTQNGTRTTPTFNELRVTEYADIIGYARLNSPAFTGIPTTPSASPGVSTDQIASTKFVHDAIAAVAGSLTQLAGIGVPGYANYNIISNDLLCTIQAGSMVLGMTVKETSGRPVTVFIGTTPGGSDLVPAFPVPPGDIVAIDPLAMAHSVWRLDQSIYISSASWAGATVDVMTWYAFPAGTVPPTGGGGGGSGGGGGGSGADTVPRTVFAAGSTQISGSLIGNGDWVVVGGAGGVTLQTTGGVISLFNATTGSINVYPMPGATLLFAGGALAVNAPMTLPTGATAWLRAVSPTQVYAS